MVKLRNGWKQWVSSNAVSRVKLSVTQQQRLKADLQTAALKCKMTEMAKKWNVFAVFLFLFVISPLHTAQ